MPQLTVAEKPDPLPTTVAAGLKRTLTADVPAGKTVWLLVGATTKDVRIGNANGTGSRPLSPKGTVPEVDTVGSRVILPADGAGATVVDVVAAPAKTAWRFVPRPGGGWVALLRLPEAERGGTAHLTLSTWGLPRDEEELVNGLPRK
jgi:hypothetical protein